MARREHVRHGLIGPQAQQLQEHVGRHRHVPEQHDRHEPAHPRQGATLLEAHPHVERDEAEVRIEQRGDGPVAVRPRGQPLPLHHRLLQAGPARVDEHAEEDGREEELQQGSR